jgi:hypothetical protein
MGCIFVCGPGDSTHPLQRVVRARQARSATDIQFRRQGRSARVRDRGGTLRSGRARTGSDPAAHKRAEPPRLLLDDAQISALRTRLKLTPTQEEFWPAVEVTLRNVVRQHARKTPKNGRSAPPQIDANSAEVQQLISAAVPLIMRMSETQKREVRQLARIIGLDTVASRI